MKEYKVISAYTTLELGKIVSIELKDGWELVGGVTTTSIPALSEFYKTIYSQALAR